MKLAYVILLLTAIFISCAGTKSGSEVTAAVDNEPPSAQQQALSTQQQPSSTQPQIQPTTTQSQTQPQPQPQQQSSAETGSGGETEGSASSIINAVELSAEKIAGELPRGSRVAIVAFESASDALSGFIMEELAGALADRGLEIADRQNLDFVYRELAFQMSGAVDDEQIKAVGRFLAADMVISGQLIDAGGSYRFRTSATHVERGARASVSRLDVSGSEETRRFIEAVTNNPASVRTAGYGESRPAGRMSAGAFIDRGIRYALRREYASAINDFGMAQMLQPNLAAAFALRGRALLASAHHPSTVAEDFSFVATRRWPTADRETRETFKKAIDEYTEAIRLDPQNPKYYWERAGIYHRAGRGDADTDIAMADYDMAIKLDSNFVWAYNDRAVFCFRMGRCDVDKKIADLEHALKLEPDFADAKSHLIDAYFARAGIHEKNGDYDNAIKDYETVLRLGLAPNHPWRPAESLERVKAKKAGTYVDPNSPENK